LLELVKSLADAALVLGPVAHLAHRSSWIVNNLSPYKG
jgi:hypothetical protein